MSAIGSASVAVAQFAGDDITRACKQDIQRFCPQAKPGSDEEIECLDQNFEKLGKACVSAIEGDPATASVGGNEPPTGAPQPPVTSPRGADRPTGAKEMAEPPRDRPARESARSYYDRQDPRPAPGQGDVRAPERPIGPPERADDARDDRARAARQDDRPATGRRMDEEPRRGPPPSMRDCRQDIAQYCRGLQGRERGSCIRENTGRFSAACQAALRERRQMHRDYRQACRQDLRRLCAGARQGIAKIDCMIQQERSLSPACSEALNSLPMVERRRRLMTQGGAPRR